MFLMLGETVLQIVIGVADVGSGAQPASARSFFDDQSATATASFLMAGCMLLSFRAMISGQLISYERTNEGLAQETEEVDHHHHPSPSPSPPPHHPHPNYNHDPDPNPNPHPNPARTQRTHSPWRARTLLVVACALRMEHRSTV
jgi:hypothetical protein